MPAFKIDDAAAITTGEDAVNGSDELGVNALGLEPLQELLLVTGEVVVFAAIFSGNAA